MKKLLFVLLLFTFILSGCSGTTTGQVTTTSAINEVKNIELRVYENKLQWRYTDESSWTDLLDVDTIGGLTVKAITINDQGELIITYSDDTSDNLGQFLKNYLVQFVDLEGNIISAQLIPEGYDAVAPTPPEIPGYEFVSWTGNYLDVTSNLVIYGAYEALTYQLIFDSQGGSLCESLSFNYGDNITLPIPSKNGYTFKGWFKGIDNNSEQLFNTTALTANLTVYARWQESSIKYVSNEAELKNALNDSSIEEIIFMNDIEVYGLIEIKRGVTINGNGYSIGTYSVNSVFFVKEITDLSSDYNVYPSNGEVKFMNIEFLSLRENEYRPTNSAIQIYGVHNMKILIDNVIVGGFFSFGFHFSYCESLNINISDSVINGLNDAIFMSGEKFDLYIHNSTLNAPLNLDFQYLNYSYVQVINSTFNILPNTHLGVDSSALFTSSTDYNVFYFKDSNFNSLLDVNTPGRVVNSIYETNHQEVEFQNCNFEVGYPVLSYLFNSASLKTSFEYFGSTIILKEGITNIPDFGFANGNYLQRIILPSTLTTIGNNAFQSTFNITSLIIPEGVISIGNLAFSDMPNLSHIYLPASLAYVGNDAFQYGSNDVMIYLNESINQTGWHTDWNKENNNVTSGVKGAEYLDNICYILRGDNSAIVFDYVNTLETDITIPEVVSFDSNDYTVKVIGQSAFINNKKLISVTLPETLEVIGVFAFYNNSNLEEVIIPELSSLILIDNYAFEYCSNLKQFTLPVGITEISTGTFAYCERLVDVDLSQALNLDSIGDYAFYSSPALETITIPDSVTVIGQFAFNNAYSLTEVNISPTSSLEIIDVYAFSNTSIRQLYLPASLIEIKSAAFNNNYLLEEVEFAEGSILETIGTFAFSNNHNLTTIELPDSLQFLDAGAFYNCQKLESIYIPSGVTSINGDTFHDCVSLTEVIFADINTLSYIGIYAFRNAVALETFFIPESVTYVGYAAFDNIPFLVIYCQAPSKPVTWDLNWNIDLNAVVWGYPGF